MTKSLRFFVNWKGLEMGLGRLANTGGSSSSMPVSAEMLCTFGIFSVHNYTFHFAQRKKCSLHADIMFFMLRVFGVSEEGANQYYN